MSTTENVIEAPEDRKGRLKASLNVVMQRVNSASLLMDNKNRWQDIPLGLVVYVAFGGDASVVTSSRVVQAQLEKACAAILHLPIMTEGHWGDGSAAKSMLKMVEAKHNMGIMVIPQAALSASLKGYSAVKYYHQLDKDEARRRYAAFTEILRREVKYALHPEEKARDDMKKVRARIEAKKSAPIEAMFRIGAWAGRFSEYDEKGIPTHDSAGEQVSKKKRKKYMKLYAARLKKDQKRAKAQAAKAEAAKAKAAKAALAASTAQAIRSDAKLVKSIEAANSAASTALRGAEKKTDAKQSQTQPSAPSRPENSAQATPEKIKVVCGTFGNRQGLKIDAVCGPFTHGFSLED